MYGMNKKILRIDLSTENSKEIEIAEDLIENYIGGRGLGVKLFTDHAPKNLDPLSRKNPLIFAVGPFTALNIPTSGRTSLTTRSPLTNTIFSSNSGGFWGPYLKRCGYDCLFIEGKLSNNNRGYIVIDGKNGAEVEEAEKLWGLKTEIALKELNKLEGKNSQTLLIGPAGENLVRFSSIMNQAHRAFGRGGVGAVMGSKGIKAIVVKNGRKKFSVYDPAYLKKINKVAIDKIKVVPITSQGMHLFGTSVLIKVINSFGMLPVKNNQEAFTQDEKLIDKISGETLRDRYFRKSEGCYNCIIKCGRLTNTDEMSGKGPEYESLWALGPQIGIYDLKTITHANYLCNSYGLDTISTGGTISCAMELAEKGMIEENSLKFGEKEIICDLIKNIATKRKIGSQLAEGSLKLSKTYKSNSISMSVKGLELPAYDPRGAFGHALNYAVSNRGACHLTGFLVALEVLGVPKLFDRFAIMGKADQLYLKQNQSAIEDSLIVCKFVGYALGLEFQVRFFNALTGKSLTITDLLEVGERIYNLERLYNVREGFRRKEDTLPERFLKEPLMKGSSQNRTVPLEKLLDDYYKVRGWDNEGIPQDDTLERLFLKRL
ncbi:MAG: aldehyde ferredoxin oxidoreductase [Candidatus Lokiarchaeota archaeon]|nr:aldehyde ferredoxin oxidoreductase [Candidatus Lokiarchaeota archaeon]MBD3342401.1 aldehyde ferredoxin oxidoreductase [Candidatus Lokiarchaeota archaeon]